MASRRGGLAGAMVEGDGTTVAPLRRGRCSIPAVSVIAAYLVEKLQRSELPPSVGIKRAVETDQSLGARPRCDSNDAVFAVRERGGGRTRLAVRCPLLCPAADRLPDGSVRASPPCRAHCDRSRHRNRQGYTLRRGSGCRTNGVHFILYEGTAQKSAVFGVIPREGTGHVSP